MNMPAFEVEAVTLYATLRKRGRDSGKVVTLVQLLDSVAMTYRT